MKRPLFAVLLLSTLFLAACADTGTTGPASIAGPGGPDPASLPMIRLYNSKLGVGDYFIEVTPAGELSVQEHRGGDNVVTRSALHLTQEQITAIQNVFKGWKNLPSESPGEWSALVEITYNNYTIRAHDLTQAPKPVTDAMATLVNLARSAVAITATQPAMPATPASAATPAPTEPLMPAPGTLVPRN